MSSSLLLPPRSSRLAQAERINLLKQAVERYGSGKSGAELTPMVVFDKKRKADHDA